MPPPAPSVLPGGVLPWHSDLVMCVDQGVQLDLREQRERVSEEERESGQRRESLRSARTRK